MKAAWLFNILRVLYYSLPDDCLCAACAAWMKRIRLVCCLQPPTCTDVPPTSVNGSD